MEPRPEPAGRAGCADLGSACRSCCPTDRTLAANDQSKRLRSLFDDLLLVQVGSRMELTPRAANLRESVADALRRVHTLLAAESFDPARSTRQWSRHVAVVGAGLSEDPVDAWLREKGLSRDIVLRVPSYLQALQATSRADVVAFVPRRLARSMARRFSLQLLPPPIEPGDYQEQLFYPRRASQDPASIWLRTLARRIAKNLDRADRA